MDTRCSWGEMKRKIAAFAVALCCAVVLTGCRDPEARVHQAIRNDAVQLAVAAADLAHRGGLADHDVFARSLQTLPYDTRRGFGSFRWEGDAMRVPVSFSTNIQKTEAEGAGRYSARSCAVLSVDSRAVELLPADCPADIPLEYGSYDVADYRLPGITRKVQSRWQ